MIISWMRRQYADDILLAQYDNSYFYLKQDVCHIGLTSWKLAQKSM